MQLKKKIRARKKGVKSRKTKEINWCEPTWPVDAVLSGPVMWASAMSTHLDHNVFLFKRSECRRIKIKSSLTRLYFNNNNNNKIIIIIIIIIKGWMTC
jgi:hypothetical protein